MKTKKPTRGNKSRAYILDTVLKYGECHIGWRGDYGQRMRNAAYALRDEGLIVITDVQKFSSGRVSAIAKLSEAAKDRDSFLTFALYRF